MRITLAFRLLGVDAQAQRPRVVLFGAGTEGRIAAAQLRADSGCTLLGAIDNDHSKWGSVLHEDVLVFAPAKIAEWDPDVVLITSVRHAKALVEQARASRVRCVADFCTLQSLLRPSYRSAPSVAHLGMKQALALVEQARASGVRRVANFWTRQSLRHSSYRSVHNVARLWMKKVLAVLSGDEPPTSGSSHAFAGNAYLQDMFLRNISEDESVENYHRLRAVAEALPAEERAAISSSLVEAETVNSIAAVLSIGRSGSYLFMSLLDGHPQVVPFINVALQNYYPWFSERETWSPEAIIGFILSKLPDQELGGAQYRDRFLGALFHLLERRPTSTRALRGYLLRAIFLAFHAARGKPAPQAPTILVYSLHAWDPARARAICEDFERAYFITALRTPHVTLASSFRNHIRDLPMWPILEAPRQILRLHLTGDAPMTRAANAVSIGVRFEDMHYATRPLTEKLCQRLGLRWDDCLLSPTVNREPFVFPRRTADGGTEPIVGLGHQKMLSRQPEWLSDFDRFRLMLCQLENYRAWEYAYPRILNNRTIRRLLFHLTIPVPFVAERQAFRRAVAARGRSGYTETLRTVVRAWPEYREFRRELSEAFRRRTATPSAELVPALVPDEGGPNSGDPASLGLLRAKVTK